MIFNLGYMNKILTLLGFTELFKSGRIRRSLATLLVLAQFAMSKFALSFQSELESLLLCGSYLFIIRHSILSFALCITNYNSEILLQNILIHPLEHITSRFELAAEISGTREKKLLSLSRLD